MSNLQSGMPPKHMITPADPRYAAKYNFCIELNGWILVNSSTVIDEVTTWNYHLADPDFGQPIGAARTTTLDLWANRWADRPFPVDDADEIAQLSVEAWFKALFEDQFSPLELDAKYRMYATRIEYSSSWAALKAIGAVKE